MKKTILVLARKYNDIFYAINCVEFKEAKWKKLVIITNGENLSYPCQELFNEIIWIHSSDVSWKGQLKLLFKLFRIRGDLRCDILFTSNIVLLSHLFIAKLSSCKSIVLLEDGYMNYRSDNFDTNKKKDLVLTLLAISKNNILNKIQTSYLLDPDNSKYFYGRRKRLLLNSHLLPIYKGPDLTDKNIFVGQALYLTHPSITMKDYTDIVNKIIKEYNIDYYIPHFYSSQEHINSETLPISSWGVTLEVLASSFKFNLFSFSSSLLFTTKLLNPEIKSTMIKHPKIPEVKDNEIFVKTGIVEKHLH